MYLKIITLQIWSKKKIKTLSYTPEGNRAIKKKKQTWKAYSKNGGVGYFDCQYANEEGYR